MEKQSHIGVAPVFENLPSNSRSTELCMAQARYREGQWCRGNERRSTWAMKQTLLPWAPRAQGASAGQAAGKSHDHPQTRLQAEDSPWQADPQWKQFVSELSTFAGTLKVVDLCGGLGTGYIALSLLLPPGSVALAGVWDTDEHLEPFLSCVHPNSSALHLGGVCGNLLERDPGDVELGHIIVAGPPCPPWSRLGNKKSMEDPRGPVFWAAIDIIVHQAKNGILGLFIVENVEGITHKPSGALEAASDVFMAELRAELPDNWTVGIVVLNSAHYGLPQSRGRAFIVGHCHRLFGNGDIRAPPPFKTTVPLATLLDHSDTRQNEANSVIQAENLRDWKLHFRKQLDDPSAVGSFAVFDISRTPGEQTSWSAKGNINAVECLTATGPNLHVLSLGGGMDQPCAIDRRLRGHERARIQGFPPMLCELAAEQRSTKRIFGNAMTVPVLGSLLAVELASLLAHSSPSAILHWCNSSVSGAASSASSGNANAGGQCPEQASVVSVASASPPASPHKRCRTEQAGIMNTSLGHT